ncbi:MAG TPA: hypothetical protein DCQ31_09370 [Bacteroidales bacterium]|nr:hypothetical protein [Bacteroidales bacterium]
MKALDTDTLSFSSNVHSLTRWGELTTADKLDVLPDFVVSPGTISDSSFVSYATLNADAFPYLEAQIPDWIFVIFIVAFGMLAIVQVRYYRYLELSVLALFNRRRIDSLYRNIDIKSPLSEFILFVNYIIISAVVMFLLSSIMFNLHFGKAPFFDYLSLFVFVLLIYLVKVAAIKLLGYVFSETDMAKNYITYVAYHNRMAGLILLPLTFILIYSNLITYNTAFYLIAILLFAVYIVRLYRGAQIFILKDVSIVYLILYLCALEILPLLLILKAVYRFLN